MKKIFFALFLSITFLSSFAQDGLLDSSFNTTGKVISNFGGFNASLNAIQITPTGKIIVAGSVASGFSYTTYDFMVAQFNIDGSPDLSFGTNGKTFIDFSSNFDAVNALCLQSDGKILVTGRSTSNVYYDIAVTRLDANGQLDASFGTNGKVLVDVQGENDEARAIQVQHDGKILIAGLSSTATVGAALALRLNTDGSLDNSFGTSGHVLCTFTGVAYFSSCLVMNDGSIVCAGSTIVLGNSRIAMAKMNPNGSLQTNFGTNGQAEFVESAGQSACAAIQFNPFDQNFYLAGMGVSDAMLLSVKSNGTENTSFGNKGRVSFDLGGSEIFNSFRIDNNGDFLLCGNNAINADNESFVAKLKANGSADLTWGNNGATRINWTSNNDYGTAMCLQSDGKLLMTGSENNGASSHIARFNNSTTAINGIKSAEIQKSVFNCYPNPASDFVHLQGMAEKVETIQLISLDRVKLLTSNNNYFNISCIPNGNYLVLIRMQDGSFKTAPLIIVH
jgi:uncharacterized delta-60 repeat protein